MEDPTCDATDCNNSILARGLCQLHYGRAYRSGQVPPRPPRLSDIDLEAMTVTCAIHGPGSRLRVRSAPKEGRYACRTCSRGKRHGTPEARLRQRIKAKYGISFEEYLLLLAAQGGLCLICQEPPPGEERLVVDHDHATGSVRGLLCRPCNLALGFMRDSPQNLTRAAKYLRRKQA